MDSKPKRLYHYTNQIGFLGILEKRAIWATQIHYLNDAKEFWLGVEMTLRLMKQRISKNERTIDVHKLTRLSQELASVAAVGMRVASFSALPDSLGQWRGYVGNQPGFSIGFNFEGLEKLAEKVHASIAPCLYERKDQQARIEKLIDESLSDNFLSFAYDEWNLDHRKTFANEFADQLFDIVPLLKHPAFSAEEEWRIVHHQLIGVTDLPLKHRPGQSMLVPYVSIDLGSDLSCIEEIIVGPCAHPELALNSVEDLISANADFRHMPELRNSTAPFRYW